MRPFKVFFTGLLSLACVIHTAAAAPILFDLNEETSREGIFNNTYARQYNYEAGDLSLALTGWSYGTRIDNSEVCVRFNKGKCTKYDIIETTTVLEAIEQSHVGQWGGLGVEKANSPNHGVDNENGDYDMHLLAFDEVVKLTTLNLGWQQNDSDISVLAFVGSVFDQSSLAGRKWQDLVGNGWSVVGNYYNLDHAGNSGAVNQGNLFSQYWLVGAYNANFGSVFSGSNRDKSSGADYYKLQGLSVERQPAQRVVDVTEPATGLLFGVALAGLVFTRRRMGLDATKTR